MPVVAPPETANLLEASNTSATPEPSLPRPTVGAKAAGSPVKPSVAASPKAVPGTTLPSAQISKEEQENLSQLGDRLKSARGAGSIERDAAEQQADFRVQVRAGQSDGGRQSGESRASLRRQAKTPRRSAMSEESRRQFLKKLSKPRTNMK